MDERWWEFVVGIYPLMPDESCWPLAPDFVIRLSTTLRSELFFAGRLPQTIVTRFGTPRPGS